MAEFAEPRACERKASAGSRAGRSASRAGLRPRLTARRRTSRSGPAAAAPPLNANRPLSVPSGRTPKGFQALPCVASPCLRRLAWIAARLWPPDPAGRSALGAGSSPRAIRKQVNPAAPPNQAAPLTSCPRQPIPAAPPTAGPRTANHQPPACDHQSAPISDAMESAERARSEREHGGSRASFM